MDFWPLWDLFYLSIGTAFSVIGYYLWFVPMNRIRTLDDVGFAHLNLPPKLKRQKMIQLKRSKKLGNPPPPFPNGWYVLAESREVMYNLFLLDD
jgi:cholesterol 7-dehydrogenase